MRRFALAILVSVSSLALMGGGQAPPPRRMSFSDTQKADLDRISAYLNSIRTMKGSFAQLDGNGGLAQGTFWLQKPGRMRFEYLPGAQLVVVADGSSITVRNNKLNTTDHYPLISSPLEFVLSNTLNLKSNPLIVGVDHDGSSIVVHARSATNRMTGNITMVFSDPGTELRQWTIADGGGQLTTVSLSDVQTGIAIPASAFVTSDLSKPLKNNQN